MKITIAINILLMPWRVVAELTDDYTGYVSIFRGTGNGGNMFPGVAAAPFALVKLGPDAEASPPTDAYSGYLPRPARVNGFSLLHESGTGGAPKYGVVAQMPFVGDLQNPASNLSRARVVDDEAGVGWYHSKLEGGIDVRLAASPRAGMLAYDFRKADAGLARSVVVDVAHVLPSFRGNGWGQGFAGGQLRVDESGGYEGFGIYNGGWNLSPNWTIYFCGIWNQPVNRVRLFKGNDTTTLDEQAKGTSENTTSADRGNLGAVFGFDAGTVTSRIGVSFVSIDKARANLEDEIPGGTAQDELVARAKQAWNGRVLSKIHVSSASRDDLVQLYSNMYGMHLIPSNRSGEQPWDSTEPYYDDIFTFWDLFRCTTALVHILSPRAYVEQLRSLVEIWRKEGWLPDARSSNWSGETQGGSNADNILADAYVKGVEGVNWTDAYHAMRQDAEIVPPNNQDSRAPDSSTRQGRGALSDWKRFGYITPTFSRAVSRGIEYAANDFGLAQISKGLGIRADASRYLKRSRNWRNYWTNAQSSFNQTGFLLPRLANGSFQLPYDPTQCGNCYWTAPYYEATPWEYTFAAGHHDMAHVIKLSGGARRFVDKLDTLFIPGLAGKTKTQFNGTLINPGNEPSFTTPHLYHYARRPDLAVERSRYIARQYYGSGPGGIPGNSDAGAMQSWQLWNMLGLYPMTGQDVFLLGSPWFGDVRVDLDGGKTLTITATTGAGADSYHVQRVRINGQVWRQSWVRFDDIFGSGGRIEFELGRKPVRWATGALPPSPAS